MKRQPRGHSTRIVVARQAVGLVGVVVTNNLMDALRAEIGTVYPVIEAGSEERRFVLHVVVAFLEEEVEALAELLLSSTGTDESRNVVRHRERILLTGGLIEECRPPRQIPRCHLRHRSVGMEHFRMPPRHRIHPMPLGILRQDETAHPIPFVIAAPEVTPRLRLRHVFLVEVLPAEAARHLRYAPITESIFNRSVASTVDAIGNVTQTEVLRESATAVLLMIGTWINSSILEHRLEGKGIVDALQSFGIGIGNNHLCIRTSLRATIAVAAAGIGHVALPHIYI